MPFNPRTLGNIFSDYGQGLLRGRNLSEALAYGAQQGSQMQPYRDAQLQQEQQQSKLEQQTNQTIEWLKSHGYDDLVAAVGGGMPIGTAWQEGLTRFNAKPAAPRTGEINNRLVNMDTGQVIGDYSDPTAAPQAPAGYRYTVDGNMEAVPGGPADKGPEQAQAAQVAQVASQRADAQTDSVIGSVDKAIEQAGASLNGFGYNTGLAGAAQSLIPGTPGYDLRRTIDTVKANLGFEALQAMRDASPTGGALGQITERELAFLQSTVANLDANQSQQQLLANLLQVRQSLQRLKGYRAQMNDAKFGPVTSGDGWQVIGVE